MDMLISFLWQSFYNVYICQDIKSYRNIAGYINIKNQLYHTAFITIDLLQVMKKGSVSSPTLLLFCNILLALLGPLNFYMNFKVKCQYWRKNAAGILKGTALNLHCIFGSITILIILSLSIYKHGISFHLFNDKINKSLNDLIYFHNIQ